MYLLGIHLRVVKDLDGWMFKKQVKYVEVDNTKVNGVIVWGKNSKSNTLKVGTDLIADSFNELATSLAISSALYNYIAPAFPLFLIF